tara:strand:- start:437 stop:580 length:144 start_codon:yes stop_codon:yes gene_type:complete
MENLNLFSEIRIIKKIFFTTHYVLISKLLNVAVNSKVIIVTNKFKLN